MPVFGFGFGISPTRRVGRYIVCLCVCIYLVFGLKIIRAHSKLFIKAQKRDFALAANKTSIPLKSGTK